MTDAVAPVTAVSSPSAPANAAGLGSALTSEAASNEAKQCNAGRHIGPEEGARIVAAAAQWAGTPYSMVGNKSVRGSGGDCSGSTNKSYVAAGFPYVFQATGSFIAYSTRTHRFVEIAAGEKKQPGDILWWPGHMAIYAEFDPRDPNHTTSYTGPRGDYKMFNNMWTAFNARTGDPYGVFDYKKFRPKEEPRVFRYFLHHGEPGC